MRHLLDQKNSQYNELKKISNDSLFTIYQAAGPGMFRIFKLFFFFFNF